MSRMSDLHQDICFLLDTTRLCCQEIADVLKCPVSWVNEIVEQRWKKVCYASVL